MSDPRIEKSDTKSTIPPYKLHWVGYKVQICTSCKHELQWHDAIYKRGKEQICYDCLMETE